MKNMAQKIGYNRQPGRIAYTLGMPDRSSDWRRGSGSQHP
jgi:hypothetical protein